MATTRLQLYNAALQLCGEGPLATLSENVKGRRALDLAWDNGGVRYCLERGQWQFAIRSQQMDSDPDIDPAFGYQNAFGKPDDWVNTSAVCSDPYYKAPLLAYADEEDFWYADIDPIYVKFVSDDAAFGSNLGRWPQSFVNFGAAYFASQIISGITADKQRMEALLRPRTGILAEALKVARSQAQMTQPTRFPAPGSWVMSRGSRRRNGWDGGNTGNLTG